MSAILLILIGLVALALFILGMGLLVAAGRVMFAPLMSRPTLARHGTADPVIQDVQVRRIRVNEGYKPSEVHVDAGRPIRLLFRREETAPCSERVVFPDYGISFGLPPFEEVAVNLPAGDPGPHCFSGATQMLLGNLVVEPNAVTRAAAPTHEAVAA